MQRSLLACTPHALAGTDRPDPPVAKRNHPRPADQTCNRPTVTDLPTNRRGWPERPAPSEFIKIVARPAGTNLCCKKRAGRPPPTEVLKKRGGRPLRTLVSNFKTMNQQFKKSPGSNKYRGRPTEGFENSRRPAATNLGCTRFWGGGVLVARGVMVFQENIKHTGITVYRFK